MRADRLVATLLLLQARGTVTASEVAEELEVSERTSRRDLDALIVSGIPIYSKQGRGGGWTLMGGATTDLTGLRSPEARALMTMAAASGQADPAFVSAIRKLTQAMPEPVRREAERVVGAVIADPSAWRNQAALQFEERRTDWVEPLQEAVIDRRRVELTYDTPRSGRSVRIVEPLGLVLKRGDWFLLADTDDGRRTFRLDRMVHAEASSSTFVMDDRFDLEAAWRETTAGYAERSSAFTTSAIAADGALGPLRALGVDTVVHAPTEDGRHVVTLGAWNVEVLAAQIAGIVDRIELVEPAEELARELARIGRELVSRFAGSAAG